MTWERISQKLIFGRRDREVRVLSYDLGGYLSFSWAIVAILGQSVLLVTSFSFYYGRDGLGVPLPRGFVPLP